MTDQSGSDKRRIIRYPGGGFFGDVADYLRLVLRLLQDDRVKTWLKFIPFGSLVYFILPFDIPTPIDDIAVMWLGMNLFIELCPPEIVAEHRAALTNIVESTLRDPQAEPPETKEE
ncbi:MAG: hypothetical protein DWQ07_20835 [Chloroflexi bacterium]|nr:MAG: hypothetical protein DWQ07_20835 [Chloroflexota bacterium]MBL1194531.1 hypothetical protein [Chloroflexota bacterium]NOH11819.1 hypothetical protein [Chloroflexota bacterium]